VLTGLVLADMMLHTDTRPGPAMRLRVIVRGIVTLGPAEPALDWVAGWAQQCDHDHPFANMLGRVSLRLSKSQLIGGPAGPRTTTSYHLALCRNTGPG